MGGLRWHAVRVGRLLRSTEGVGAESNRVTGWRRVAGSRSREGRASHRQAGWRTQAWRRFQVAGTRGPWRYRRAAAGASYSKLAVLYGNLFTSIGAVEEKVHHFPPRPTLPHARITHRRQCCVLSVSLSPSLNLNLSLSLSLLLLLLLLGDLAAGIDERGGERASAHEHARVAIVLQPQ